jgi:hypothetical protein
VEAVRLHRSNSLQKAPALIRKLQERT